MLAEFERSIGVDNSFVLFARAHVGRTANVNRFMTLVSLLGLEAKNYASTFFWSHCSQMNYHLEKNRKISMSHTVRIRHLSSFFAQVYDMLDNDGMFYLQIPGLRKSWQYEDLIWGLFMNKYIFPGADASAPLAPVVDRLEGNGFEIKSIDTIGLHYSANLWR